MKKEVDIRKLQLSRETLLTLKTTTLVAGPDETSNNTGKFCCKCA